MDSSSPCESGIEALNHGVQVASFFKARKGKGDRHKWDYMKKDILTWQLYYVSSKCNITEKPNIIEVFKTSINLKGMSKRMKKYILNML